MDKKALAFLLKIRSTPESLKQHLKAFESKWLLGALVLLDTSLNIFQCTYFSLQI